MSEEGITATVEKHKSTVVVGLVIFFVIIMLLFTMSISFASFGKGQGELGANGLPAGGSGSTVSCSGVANVKPEYMPWVADAANKYLKGDQAALISIIQIESSWNPNATHGGNATGLGQFTYTTAKGMPFFIGGTDKMGMTWDPGNVYPNSLGHSNDTRFDPKRSIYATANLLGHHMSNNDWDLRTAYIEGYHSYDRKDPVKGAKQKKEAMRGADRLMAVYDGLKSGGGCTGGEGEIPGGSNTCSNITSSGKPAMVDPKALSAYCGAKLKTGGSWSITQGLGNAKASGVYHHAEPNSKYTAALDVSVRSKTKPEIEKLVRNMRLNGWAVWYRSCSSNKDWCGNEHIHGAYAGVPTKKELQGQINDFVVGKDGMKGDGYDTEIPVTEQEKQIVSKTRQSVKT